MTTISLAELYSNPAGHMQRVAAGETLLILDGEKVVAEIRPPNENRRPSGLAAGQLLSPKTLMHRYPNRFCGTSICNETLA